MFNRFRGKGVKTAMEKDKAKEVVKVTKHDAALAKIPEALPTATRFLSEASANLAPSAVPAVGFPAEVAPMSLSYEAQATQPPARPTTANVPAFTDAGVHAATLLSTGAAHVAHASPVVAPAAPTIALPASLLQAA
jgi:hypothetical protein